MTGKKGFALITVLITFMVLTVLGVAIVEIATNRMAMAGSYENLDGSIYTAQAGIEEVMLEIDNLKNTYRDIIEAEISLYVENNWGQPGYDPDLYSKQRTKHYIFDENLLNTTYQRTFDERNGGFDISFSQDDYDLDTGIITIRSTGIYGKGTIYNTRTVTSRVQMSFVEFEIDGEGSELGYPIIIHDNVEKDCLKPYCRDFDVTGNLYVPRETNSFADSGGLHFTENAYFDDEVIIDSWNVELVFDKELKVNNNLNIQGSSVDIDVMDGDVVIEGNLIVSSDGCQFNIYNGDLVVNGDINIDEGADIRLENGSIQCNGDILIGGYQTNLDIIDGDIDCIGDITIEDEADLTLNIGDLRCGGNISINGSESVITLESGNIDCSGELSFEKDESNGGIVLLSGSMRIEDQITLNGQGSSIYIVNGDLKCNNDFIIANIDCDVHLGTGNMRTGQIEMKKNDSSNTSLIINIGNLECEDISIKSEDEGIQLGNGDLKCDGDIGISGGSDYLIINGDLYLSGALDVKEGENITVDISGSTIQTSVELQDFDVTPPVFEMPDMSHVQFEFGDIGVFSDPEVINDDIIDENMGTLENPVVIFYDDDITIENSDDYNQIDIYGIVYATGQIIIEGYGTDGGIVNIYGMVAAGEKLEVNEYDKRVLFEYNNDVINALNGQFPDIVSYFGGSGGSGRGTEIVGVVDGQCIVSWED